MATSEVGVSEIKAGGMGRWADGAASVKPFCMLCKRHCASC
jgi:hypothetical protein